LTLSPAERAAPMVRSMYSNWIGCPSTGGMVRNDVEVEITCAPAVWASPTSSRTAS
jgi:hypothetical protein